MPDAYNPFLPSWEYVPDGEPHVFGGRVYLYGSHDRFNAREFCRNDYVCWSAPVDDLSAWRFEGYIWNKCDDPDGRGWYLSQMAAPDCVRGADGRYYLYYFKGKRGTIDVAVCDTPAGKYRYYGKVCHAGGTPLGKGKEEGFYQFDPGVFRDDDGRFYLYTGFGARGRSIFTGFRPPNKYGAMGCELAEDMLTIRSPLHTIARTRRNSRGTGFEGHEFFEASSMRKFGGRYYFIYSSVNGHELCYAMSDSPLGEFTYGGTLVSIGDVGLSDKPRNYLGNTHGSIECIGGKYYVFYHRHTNGHCFSRQACAEEISMREDGTFAQAEVTSCGLNGGPLAARGRCEARVACHLFSKKGVRFYTFLHTGGCHPYFTQSGKDRECDPDQYIANFRDGATAGFKYFRFAGNARIGVTVCGRARGVMRVRDGLHGREVAAIPISPCRRRTQFFAPLHIEDGVKPLYFTFCGKGRLDFIDIFFD